MSDETRNLQLCVGRRVYCGLYGGKTGTIVRLYGQPDPARFNRWPVARSSWAETPTSTWSGTTARKAAR